jgi:hypothetical protein
MTWVQKVWKFGETPTASQMNDLQGNITAKANADSGAPQNTTASVNDLACDTAAIAATAVLQGKIATAIGEVSGTPSTTFPVSVTLAGGQYGFHPQSRLNSGDTSISMDIGDQYTEPEPPSNDFGTITSGTYQTKAAIHAPTGGDTGYLQQRYVTASPPYDLGDGECHLFTFCLLNANGDVIATYAAPDAPWHYNGPTNIQMDQRRPILVGEGFDHRQLKSEVDSIIRNGASQPRDFAKLRQWMALSATFDYIETWEDQPQSHKNADIDLIPHPFGIVPAGYTAVLLDPLSRTTNQLRYLQQREEEWIAPLLHNGFFKISNTELSRVTPPGVPTVSYRWR